MRPALLIAGLIVAVAVCALIYGLSGGHVLFLALPLLFLPVFMTRRRP